MIIDRDTAKVRAKTIVVGVIDDRSAGALAYALQGALAESAKVRVVRVYTAPMPVLPSPHLSIDSVELEGDPVDVLTEESRHAELLVVESPADVGASLTDPLLVRIRETSATLLIEVDSRGKVIRASGPQGWQDVQESSANVPLALGASGAVIAVGVDSSPASNAAVRWARDLARVTGASLRLVGVYSEEGVVQGHRTRADAERDLHNAVSIAQGAELLEVVTCGEPADALLRSSRGASILVVGRHGTSGMMHSALGSVGDTCARLAECPVVIVPANRRISE